MQDLMFDLDECAVGQGAGVFGTDRNVEADFSVFDHDEAVSKADRFLHIVCDEHSCKSILFPQLFYQLLHVEAGEGILCTERFIQQQEGWFSDESTGKATLCCCPPDSLYGHAWRGRKKDSMGVL
ncbi:hypothetical protein AXI58_13730 [Bacillus nakamurai]|uniref:Uncharacterized protein n=1 Tax=Bacillus nakamurai TaxID=1793963 RepID=A0A150F856_9BACI|nr:hypothetical protein [Bacillus nakamurai]KXZ21035.1 hypothetical protein AXI58_13730 [Bacillus nakamurai]